jgi:bla regulator protein blaR1
VIQDVFNHLWQSTLFGGAAAVITLILRSNRAQTRYWVWFASSIKFLIPFSLLVGLGAHIQHRLAATPIRTGWVATFQEFGQPLELPGAVAPSAGSWRPVSRVDLVSAGLVVWGCGFVAVAALWLFRWRRIRALRSSARAINVPTALPVPIPIMSAPDIVEPGVVGILRPVLLLPEGVADQLNPTQLDAILAHEFCHARRRDNLTAAIHMTVQAIFWFHPLTWWIGVRLLAERERACDEEVLRGGCKPSVYAESILAICRLYLSSPLACISGVTGSNLKRRIQAIMRNPGVIGLSLGKKLILAGGGMASLVLPMVVGALTAPAFQVQDAPDWQTMAGGKLAFEAASVKLSTEDQQTPPSMPLDAGDRYYPTGSYFRADVPLWSYIQFAYKLWYPAEEQKKEIARLPKWVTADRYSIEARAAGKPTKDEFRLMVQSLLSDRFKLAARFETREAPVLALTLVKAGKPGPKLIPHADGRPCGDPAAPIGSLPAGLMGGKDDAGPENYPPMCDSLVMIRWPNGTVLAGYRNATMDQLTGSLSGIIGLGRTLIDRSGLSGSFDFTLAWAPEPTTAPPSGAPATPSDPLGSTPVQALRDQLGLKLEAARAPVKVLVIDRVQRPSEN